MTTPKTERVTLLRDFPWHDGAGDRLFCAGTKTLPAAAAAEARARGYVSSEAPPALDKPVRSAPQKAAAKPAAAKAARKPAAKPSRKAAAKPAR